MLGRGRVGRPGVIGRPVARTAAVVGSAAVVAHGIRLRGDRREDRRDDVAIVANETAGVKRAASAKSNAWGRLRTRLATPTS